MFRGILKRALPPMLQWRALSGGSVSRAPREIMVPLSVLTALQATLAGQRADSNLAAQRADAMLAAQRADMADQRTDSNLAAQRADAILAAQRADAILAAQRADATLAAQREAADVNSGHLRVAFHTKVAEARRDADFARGQVSARVLLEEAIAEPWRQWAALLPEEQVKTGSNKLPGSTTQQLQGLLRFPGVAAYLQAVEQDNNLARGALAKSSTSLYSMLCTPLHTRGTKAKPRLLPHKVFEHVGVNGLIAFAALLSLSGRDVSLYMPKGDIAKVMLRVPPLDVCTDTEVKSSKPRAVVAALDLGVDVG
jgi:hypothetical protein